MSDLFTKLSPGVSLAFFLLLQLLNASPTINPAAQGEPTCQEVIIPITITSSNYAFNREITLEGAMDLVSSLFGLLLTNIVHGTYEIAGRYCEPKVVISARSNTLQLLLHGATYNRNYWSGDGYPGYGYGGDAYSWVSYASTQGYPTFAIDRLGSGNSSQPDPILEVQVPAQVEVAHQIIRLARAGASPFPRKFNKIIAAGHSLGSVITQSLNVNYPSDCDATILTGYSKFIINFIPGIFITGELLPAHLVQPIRYGNLPVGYLEADSFPGIEYLFFYGPAGTSYYDPSFVSYDFSLRGTITIGEGATGAISAATANGYVGSVLVITGQQDSLFCGTLALQSSGPGECVGGPLNYLEETSTLYPHAKYDYYAVPNAGHCWQYHQSGKLGFEFTHNWLARRGF